MKKIKKQIDDGEVDEEGAEKIAEDWMTIADTDGSGSIDIDEWTKFVNKLEDGDEQQTGEEELKKIFDLLDVNEDGELTVKEFGTALFDLIKTTGVEGADQSDE